MANAPITNAYEVLWEQRETGDGTRVSELLPLEGAIELAAKRVREGAWRVEIFKTYLPVGN